jgi:hypothetical protein
MTGQLVLLTAVFALVLYPVIQMDNPEAWAKKPGGRHGTTTGITQSGNTQTGSQALSAGSNTQGSPGTSSSNNVQFKKKKKSSGASDQQPYMIYQMKDAPISSY